MTKTNPRSAHIFNLREVVAEVCETRHEADPAQLVHWVLDAIASADEHEALRQALHAYITGYVTRQRGSAHGDDEPGASGRKIGKPRLNGLSRFLYDREYSPARGGWILRSEVTVDDAMSMAEKREATAAHFLELATWYQSMAQAIKDGGVETVGDLPVMVQESLRASRPA